MRAKLFSRAGLTGLTTPSRPIALGSHRQRVEGLGREVLSGVTTHFLDPSAHVASSIHFPVGWQLAGKPLLQKRSVKCRGLSGAGHFPGA